MTLTFLFAETSYRLLEEPIRKVGVKFAAKLKDGALAKHPVLHEDVPYAQSKAA
jgi:peptidoglycan/LPS O-acetylase OafA/YrhL